jgi:hypothetical protein
MMGPGKYKLILTILPPDENKHAHFGRHIDKETGVAPWFKSFAVEYEFTYAGIRKNLLSKGAEAHGLRNVVAVSLAAFFLAFGGAIPRAEEEPIFTITFKDGAVSPRRLEVPANRRFQLNLVDNWRYARRVRKQWVAQGKVSCAEDNIDPCVPDPRPRQISFF